jgi:D-aminopeptidase
MPHPHDLATLGLWADGLMLNGNGELTGLGPLQTSGILNSPIMLSNTYSVGAVHTGVFSYFLKHYPGETRGSTRWPGLLPVIGECYDGVFNTIEALNTIQPETAVRALESARSDRVLQGRVGAGTGMRSFELHAGIGTASRQVTLNRENYTVGVLVNANHSRFNTMNPIVRQALEQKLGRSLEALKQQDDQDRVHRESTKPQRQGSIIVVIATNAPLIPTQLRQLALRAGLGIGAMGSTMDTTSGDGVIAFSTATPIHLDSDPPASIPQEPVLHPDALSPFYRAVVEAVTEAQINAIWASHSPSLEGGQF